MYARTLYIEGAIHETLQPKLKEKEKAKKQMANKG